MQFDKEQIKRQVLGFLIEWERFKATRKQSEPNEPGKSPLSQYMFAEHAWHDYLPGRQPGSLTSAQWQYVKDYQRKDAQGFEDVISEVFQELASAQIITVAAPQDMESGGRLLYGRSSVGTSHDHYELTHRSASFATLDLEGFLAVVTLPKGFERLAGAVSDFLAKTGKYESNIFLMMPFGQDAELSAARQAVSVALKGKGFNLVRADDTEYENGLWENICVYMLGCKYGIAMFKEVGGVGYNPNVGVEFGFMAALDKRVLILKDEKLQKLPGDLIYRLYRKVDYSQPATSVQEVEKWIKGL